MYDTVNGYVCKVTNKVYAELHNRVCILCPITPKNGRVRWAFNSYHRANYTIEHIDLAYTKYKKKACDYHH